MEKKEALSPLIRYTIVLAVLLITVIGSGVVWNSSRPVKVLDASERAILRQEAVDMVRQGVGETWQRGLPAVQGTTVSESAAGYIVQARFSISRADMADARETVLRVMKALYQSQVPVASVQLTGTYPLADVYGNVAETEVLKCGLSLATAETIKWDSLQSDELFSRLDSVWWHPSLGL
jgi:hypothetical protein